MNSPFRLKQRGASESEAGVLSLRRGACEASFFAWSQARLDGIVETEAWAG